jgi:hypothetical protein
MLLVTVHHIIIIAVAMFIMSSLVWSAQSERQPGELTHKQLGIIPPWRWIIEQRDGDGVKQSGITKYLPALITSLVAGLGCCVFILLTSLQGRPWFNFLIDGLIVGTGLVLTHLLRKIDPNHFGGTGKDKLYREGYPSNLIFGLVCGLIASVVANALPYGSNLAITICALGCGHAGLLVNFYKKKRGGTPPPTSLETPRTTRT